MISNYALVADILLLIHFGIIVFILGGQIFIVVGYFRNWRWIRNLTFRLCHLLSIGIVIAFAWANQLCPLTIWESALREAAGQQSYQGSFIQYWIGRLIYYEAPLWIFIVAYTLFGALVLISWVLVRPGND